MIVMGILLWSNRLSTNLSITSKLLIWLFPTVVRCGPCRSFSKALFTSASYSPHLLTKRRGEESDMLFSEIASMAACRRIKRGWEDVGVRKIRWEVMRLNFRH